MSRRFLFRLFAAAVPAGDHVSDRELLRRFVGTRDSAAFELLVRRHADAVWVAGLRVLGNDTDAEDVFQATFLALVRKAGSIRDACIGAWLYRVAVNAALKLKASSGRKPTVPASPEHPANAGRSPAEHLESDELASIVHQELAGLPERYRLPVVLCDLEGQTHAEAAKSLGWPIGSVSGRLSRAHTILRDRLTRRGLGVPVALIVATTAPTTAIGNAVALAAGSAVISPVVSSLVEGVLSAMRIAKLKLTAAVVAASGFVALAGVGTVYALNWNGPPIGPATEAALPRNVVAAAEPPIEGDWIPKEEAGKISAAPPTAFPDLKPPDLKGKNLFETIKALKMMCSRILGDDPPAIEPTDDTYRRMLKARLHQGRLYLQKVQEIMAVGKWDGTFFTEIYPCLDDMRSVALELWGNDPKVLIPWLEEFVIMEKQAEQFFEIRVSAGNEPPQNLNMARRHRLAAEAALWKVKKRG